MDETQTTTERRRFTVINVNLETSQQATVVATGEHDDHLTYRTSTNKAPRIGTKLTLTVEFPS